MAWEGHRLLCSPKMHGALLGESFKQKQQFQSWCCCANPGTRSQQVAVATAATGTWVHCEWFRVNDEVSEFFFCSSPSTQSQISDSKVAGREVQKETKYKKTHYILIVLFHLPLQCKKHCLCCRRDTVSYSSISLTTPWRPGVHYVRILLVYLHWLVEPVCDSSYNMVQPVHVINIFIALDCIFFYIMNHVLVGGNYCCWFFADCSADLGLLVLWGLKNPVPCSSDTDPPQPDSDSTGPVTARRLPNLQADHLWTICWSMSHFHAGKRRADSY